MFENFKIKREIRKLKNVPVNGEFLLSLRSQLEERMALNPAGENVPMFLHFRLAPALVAGFAILIFSGGGIALASQNSLPGSVLYPIKILTEDVREAMVFRPESKAKLRVEYAQKRIDELQKVLERKDIEPQKIEKVKINLERNLEKNIQKANDFIKEEKIKGRDKKELERKIDFVVGARRALQQRANRANLNLGSSKIIKEKQEEGR